MRGEPQSGKVLVAWDGSPAAATCFPVARAIADQLDASVDVLHFHTSPAEKAAFERHVEESSVDLAGLALRASGGEPAEGIVGASEEPGIDLVVLATHGRFVEPGRGLGSVAEAVVSHTQRPVLLVRPEAADTGRPSALRRLLLPLDGSPKTATAVRPAADFALRLGAAIDVLCVAGKTPPVPEKGSIGSPRYVDQAHHEWQHRCEEVAERLMRCCAACPPEVPIHALFTFGDIGPVITRFADFNKADAIVLVRRSRLQPGRARVLREVLASTPCPILLVGSRSD